MTARHGLATTPARFGKVVNLVNLLKFERRPADHLTMTQRLHSLMNYMFGPLGDRPMRSTIEWAEARRVALGQCPAAGANG